MSLPWADKKMFFVILFQLYWTKTLLLLLPFKNVVTLFENKGEIVEVDTKEFARIKKSLRLANRFSIWQNRCLVSSLAIRKYLNLMNIKSDVFIGVKQDNRRSMKAHAWLSVNGEELVVNNDEFEKLYQF